MMTTIKSVTLDDLTMRHALGDLSGLIPNIDDEVYHHKNCPGRSSSFLKKMLAPSTPAHALASLDDNADTPAKILGRAVHAAILEPEKFEARYIQMPEGMNKTTKAYKEWASEIGTKLPLHFEVFEDIKTMRDRFHRHPLSRFVRGRVEHSGFWTDEETGILCKVRPDVITDDGLVFDLKTTESASAFDFSGAIHRFGYHISAAMYLEGLSQILGYKLEKFVLIALEKSAPFGLVFYDIERAALERGERDFREALRLVKQCEQTGNWPGYPENFVNISLPNYAFGA